MGRPAHEDTSLSLSLSLTPAPLDLLGSDAPPPCEPVCVDPAPADKKLLHVGHHLAAGFLPLWLFCPPRPPLKRAGSYLQGGRRP